MNTDQVQLERRGAQRFDFHLPVGIRLSGSAEEGCGFTQDLSARGALLYTDFLVAEGDRVELTLVMPSEITLAENMRVRCRGRVVRRTNPGVGSKPAVAVHLEGYEFLPEADASTTVNTFRRVSGLHSSENETKVSTGPSVTP